MNRSGLTSMIVLGALACLLEGCSGCAYLSGEYACEADENCPFELVCAAGVCVERTALDGGAIGEGEGEGEGEGCAREVVLEGDREVESGSGLAALRPEEEGDCVVVAGDLEIQEVGSLGALEALVRVEGDLVLTELEASSLRGLERLRSVGGRLRIVENDELRSLDGLAGLREIGGDLHVRRNRELPACEAYALRDQLTSFGGDLFAADNEGTCPGGGR